MFRFVNLRLQQIMGTRKVFGGVHLIAVGDLFQLKPVFDQWIFRTQKGPMVYSLQTFGKKISKCMNLLK